MSKTYPEVIDLPRYAHITDATIIKDIFDTEVEITELQKTQQAEETIATTSLSESERRMADFKASARPLQIAERQRFIDYLKRIQEARRAARH